MRLRLRLRLRPDPFRLCLLRQGLPPPLQAALPPLRRSSKFRKLQRRVLEHHLSQVKRAISVAILLYALKEPLPGA